MPSTWNCRSFFQNNTLLLQFPDWARLLYCSWISCLYLLHRLLSTWWVWLQKLVTSKLDVWSWFSASWIYWITSSLKPAEFKLNLSWKNETADLKNYLYYPKSNIVGHSFWQREVWGYYFQWKHGIFIKSLYLLSKQVLYMCMHFWIFKVCNIILQVYCCSKCIIWLSILEMDNIILFTGL